MIKTILLIRIWYQYGMMIRFTSAKKAFHLVFGSLSYSSLTFNTEVTTWVSKSQWRNFPSCQAECFWKCLWGINNLSQNACGASTTSVRQWVPAVYNSEWEESLCSISACICAPSLLSQHPFPTDCSWHCTGHVYTCIPLSCLPSPWDTSYLVNPCTSVFHFSQDL